MAIPDTEILGCREAAIAAATVAECGTLACTSGLSHAVANAVAHRDRPYRFVEAVREEHQAHVGLIHCIFGNPFRALPALLPLTECGRQMAAAIYRSENFAALPILADALEEAGSTDQAILEYCRGPGPHVRGCWLIDLLLGKE